MFVKVFILIHFLAFFLCVCANSSVSPFSGKEKNHKISDHLYANITSSSSQLNSPNLATNNVPSSISIKVQPKSRYRKLRIGPPESDNGTTQIANNTNVNDLVSFLMKRAGQLYEPSSRTLSVTRRPRLKSNQNPSHQHRSISKNLVNGKLHTTQGVSGRHINGQQVSSSSSSVSSHIALPQQDNSLRLNRTSKSKSISKQHFSLARPTAVVNERNEKSLNKVIKSDKTWSERKKSKTHHITSSSSSPSSSFSSIYHYTSTVAPKMTKMDDKIFKNKNINQPSFKIEWHKHPEVITTSTIKPSNELIGPKVNPHSTIHNSANYHNYRANNQTQLPKIPFDDNDYESDYHSPDTEATSFEGYEQPITSAKVMTTNSQVTIKPTYRPALQAATKRSNSVKNRFYPTITQTPNYHYNDQEDDGAYREERLSLMNSYYSDQKNIPKEKKKKTTIKSNNNNNIVPFSNFYQYQSEEITIPTPTSNFGDRTKRLPTSFDSKYWKDRQLTTTNNPTSNAITDSSDQEASHHEPATIKPIKYLYTTSPIPTITPKWANNQTYSQINELKKPNNNHRRYQFRRPKSSTTSTTTTSSTSTTEDASNKWENLPKEPYETPLETPINGFKDVVYDDFDKNYRKNIPQVDDQNGKDTGFAESVDSKVKSPQNSENGYLFPIDITYLDQYCKNKTNDIENGRIKTTHLARHHQFHPDSSDANSDNNHNNDDNYQSEDHQQPPVFGERNPKPDRRGIYNMKKISYQYKPTSIHASTTSIPTYDYEISNKNDYDYETTTASTATTERIESNDDDQFNAQQNPSTQATFGYETNHFNSDWNQPKSFTNKQNDLKYFQNNANHKSSITEDSLSSLSFNDVNDNHDDPNLYPEYRESESHNYPISPTRWTDYDPYSPESTTPTTTEGSKVSIEEDKIAFDNFDNLDAKFKIKKPSKSQDNIYSSKELSESRYKHANDNNYHDSRDKNYHQSGHHEESRIDERLNYDKDNSKNVDNNHRKLQLTDSNKQKIEEYQFDDSYQEMSGIPGNAGRDYPTMAKLPETFDFTCKNQFNGFYADMKHRCQVYHHCNNGIIQSFLCPNGTVFNQESFVCSWWFTTDCNKSDQYYHLNEQLSKTTTTTPAPKTSLPVGYEGSWQRKKVADYQDVYLDSEREYSSHHDYPDIVHYHSNINNNNNNNNNYNTGSRYRHHHNRYRSSSSNDHPVASSSSSSSSGHHHHPYDNRNYRYNYHSHHQRPLNHLDREFNHFSSPIRYT